MIQWLALKTFAKKAWVWLKNYWYYPMFVVVAILAWCLGMRGNNGVLKMFEASKESYQKEIAILKKAHEQEIEKRNQLIEKHNQALKKIEEDYKIKLDELSSAERREIKKIVKEHEDDPEGLAERVGDVFGIKHME